MKLRIQSTRICAGLFCCATIAKAQQLAAPLIFEATDEWVGNDGPWSAFILQIGTPFQQIRVLPASSATSVFAVLEQGCSLPGYPSNCSDIRGGLYAGNDSATFRSFGLYETGQNTNLGIDINALYGTDVVSLSSGGSVLTTLDDAIVAQIAAPDIWVGLFGMSPVQTNFSALDTGQFPAFFTRLRSDEWIASRSWSYTAGSVGRGTPGSLILGGYDASLFDSSTTLSTPFSQDAQRDLMLNIDQISILDNGRRIAISDSSFVAFIDSAVGPLWLPQRLCQSFEQVFNLTWDETVNFYMVDDDHHNQLLSRNMFLEFALSGSNGTSTTLSLSYNNALSLTLGFPYFNTSSEAVNTTHRYFPLRRSANATQYVLGRAFLQEIYLIADYDRNILNISQASFDASHAPRLYTILPPDNTSTPANTTDPMNESSAGLDGGAIAGVAIGAVAALAIGYLIYAFVIHRWPFSRKTTPLEDPVPGKAELHGEGKPFVEAPDGHQVVEVSGKGRPAETGAQIEMFEMPVQEVAQELPAGDVDRISS